MLAVVAEEREAHPRASEEDGFEDAGFVGLLIGGEERVFAGLGDLL